MPNGGQLIDIGSETVYWADRNVGATSPTDPGNYYSWAETSTQSSYTNNRSDYDHSITWSSLRDAATVNWEEPWRTPIKEEFDELLNLVTNFSFVEINTIAPTLSGNFLQMTLSNGKKMYFPRSGYYTSSLLGTNLEGSMWSSTRYDNNEAYAFKVKFLLPTAFARSGIIQSYEVQRSERYVGLPIRPVVTKCKIIVTDGDGVSREEYYPQSTQIEITANPIDCYKFVQWSDGNTDNPRSITVTANETYVAEFELISYLVTAVPDDPSHGTTSVTVD